jgi:selenocysteine lyase/cysteine desulfurase
MNLTELTTDESLRRREFPVCADKIFLAHAAVSPLPRVVKAAMQEYLEAAARDQQEAVLASRFVAETRQRVAELTDARPDEIAFTGSTSMGLAMVAAGLTWQTGDNVVCYRDDYPSNVYPWLDLARRGVALRSVTPTVPGRITVADLDRVMDARTRLVALSSAHFVTGWRLDVDAVGRFLHDRGVLFCLDAIQTLGALRTSFRHVDFAAADAHKWLLGPLGTAILFVRREHLDRLRPPLVGWSSAACPGFIAQDELRFWPDARRYEPGSLNLTGIVGLHAALRLIQTIGLPAIEQRVLALADRLRAELATRGWRLLAQGTGAAGIVSFTKPEADLAAIHARLTATGIHLSLRHRRDGQAWLRAAPHFYNTETEIERLLAAL